MRVGAHSRLRTASLELNREQDGDQLARKKVVRKTNERKRKQIAHKPLVAVVVTVGVVAPIGAVWALMHTGATQQVATSTQAAPTLIANQSTMLPTAISGHATGRTIQGPTTLSAP